MSGRTPAGLARCSVDRDAVTFPSRDAADAALLDIRIARALYPGNHGQRRERSVYPCSQHPGCWHLSTWAPLVPPTAAPAT